MPDSNIPSCAEPLPYSNESYGYADIDFTPKSHAVFDNQVTLVAVDKVLSNQLGEITPPNQPLAANPVLPVASDSTAKPMLSSSAGADISLPTTLSGTDVNSVSVNDIVSQPAAAQPVQPVQPEPAQPAPPKPVPVQPTIKPVPMAPMNLTVPSKSREGFANPPQQPFGPAPMARPTPNKNNNLANFIYKNDPVGRIEHFGPKNNNTEKKIEHFGGKKEHFSPDMKTIDTIVIGAVIAALAYYYVSTYHPEYLANVDVSKVPIVSQLNDPNVTRENKIIIVVAVVVGLVLVTRMLK